VVEERDPAEVTTVAGTPIAPPGVAARDPAIGTEAGVARPPYHDSLRRLVRDRP